MAPIRASEVGGIRMAGQFEGQKLPNFIRMDRRATPRSPKR
jgi:hypothetical protein